MLRKTLGWRDSHSMAPGNPPFRCNPAGNDHIRGSSLTTQSMVRDATLASWLSDQKIRVHIGVLLHPAALPPYVQGARSVVR
jgi:hypothetical protein